jgi:outer membrane protein TolC
MRRLLLFTIIWAGAGAIGHAQPAPAPATNGTTLRLTVDDAVRLALEHNVDLATVKIDPQIGDTRVAAAAGVFRPVFSTSLDRNNQLQPPASFLIPTATRNDVVTSRIGLEQKLPWFGTSYGVSWDATHTDSNSILNSFNPVLQSGLSLSVSQPLLRDLAIDPARHQVAASRIDRDAADTRVREALVRTEAGVKRAYWNLVSARATVDARQSALEMAEELVRVNTAKVDVGQSPPLDLVAAQAEVAADREQVIIAETAVEHAKDELRTLIFDASDPGAWNVDIDPVDAPVVAAAPPDLAAAVANALRSRADLARVRKDIESAELSVKFARNGRLPDVRVNASYTANGLGGTEVLRDGSFPGTVVGRGSAIAFGSVLNQLFRSEYPTWKVGVSVSYPIGQATEDANYARAQLERAQARERLKSAQAEAVQQVRDAWRSIEMNAKRIDTTRAARELADERLDAERKRFEVGMSTSFLVIQAQRDLAQAKTNELAAILAYDLALVDFDALQQAGPSSPGAAGTTTVVAAPAAAAPTTLAGSGH